MPQLAREFEVTIKRSNLIGFEGLKRNPLVQATGRFAIAFSVEPPCLLAETGEENYRQARSTLLTGYADSRSWRSSRRTLCRIRAMDDRPSQWLKPPS